MEDIEKTMVESGKKGQKELSLPTAVLISGVLIAGSILLGFSWLKASGSVLPTQDKVTTTTPDTVTDGSTVKPPSIAMDGGRTMGSNSARVSVILYEDFQCPFCGKFVKEVETPLRNNYVNEGKIKFIYRDYAFLGEESTHAAEAARCAEDQQKFWEYHDYLFNHQSGENQGAFSDPNLKSFAKILGLNETTFNQCLDSGKYTKAVADSASEGTTAGVNGTPKGFILRDNKVVATIDGAEPLSMVTPKIEKALK